MEDVAIFSTTSASFQTFEVTNTATINNVVISSSLSFVGADSYSLPFAICKIPFLRTEGAVYSAGSENTIGLDSTFTINSGEFETTIRTGEMNFRKKGYYNVSAFLTLRFADYPNDTVVLRVYNSSDGKSFATKTYVISNSLSYDNSIDLGDVLELIDIDNVIYITIQTSTTNFDIASTSDGESLLSVTQIR